jgi:hypothetical protein
VGISPRISMLVAVTVLLVVALSLQTVSLRNAHWGEMAEPRASQTLHRLRLQSVPGWEATDELIGETEIVRQAAKRELNYDDYFYRSYRHEGREFAIFVAFWARNRMSTHRVISHTPDICWPMNGWQCLEYDLRPLDLGTELALSPGYWRRFQRPDGRIVHVIYWHVVGGRLFDFGGNRFNQMLEPLRWWTEAVRYGIVGTGEQYFVRVSSNTPLEVIARDAGARDALSALGALGLFAASPGENRTQ